MSYGFLAAGARDNLIIGDDNPVLRRVYSGEIHTTQVQGGYYAGYPALFAYCVIYYPAPIRTSAPPLVFGAPNGAASSGGIAAFMPLGSPGSWVGFRVVYKAPGSYRQLGAGERTGWTYHACTHESEISVGAGYGLRLFSADGRVTFDSNWPIVPFRGLLTSWVLDYGVAPPGQRDWGNESYNRRISPDVVRQVYSHHWGVNDGQLGVLISSLSGWEIWGDAGFDDARSYVIPPTIFFNGGSRSRIYCLVDAGIWQHPSIDPQAMNRFSLLTGDISRL